MEVKDQMTVRVAVALPVGDTYDYGLPDQFSRQAEIGSRVLVPFRSREVIGYILEKNPPDHERGLKDILDIIDHEPLFHEGLVPFFQWIANYYIYPIGKLIQSALPGGLNPSQYKTARLTMAGIHALALLPSNSKNRSLLDWVKKNPDKKIPPPLSSAYALQRKGLLVLEDKKTKGLVGHLKKKFIKVKDGVSIQDLILEQKDKLCARDEEEFLGSFIGEKGIALSHLTSKFSNGSYLVEKWIGKGVLEKYNEVVLRDPAGRVISPLKAPARLFKQQQEALDSIKKKLDRRKFSTCMLYGVTGSGKTEVYLRAIEHEIKQGRQAILMVPEIALAIYMEGLFRSRLSERIAIYHSGLSRGERYDQWVLMMRGKIDLVIGARSALFSPLPNLGLIIVDEEHDYSYKQDDGPRYQARDAAVVRGKMEGALVVLGSGTPSVQSFSNSLAGRYRLLEMPERIEKRPFPEIQTIDMKEVSESENNGIISPALRDAVADNLKKGKQALLFLNRRGFHRVFLCRHCGKSIRCFNCDLALVHHLREDRLICHYCGFHTRPENKCPSCGRDGVKAYGFGTEKLEEELKAFYPEARIERMDRDSTSRKGRTFDILKRFNDQQIDILVGTQMITKGYDFPNVTLVGVIAADFSLGFPDFRGGERTFQILSQVAGRAGRGESVGRVIVQTFNPEHYAITTAKAHDYRAFFQMEKELREQLGYPPFSYLACLKFKGNSKRNTATTVRKVGEAIIEILKRWPKRGKEIQVLGPAEAPLAKLRGKYRWQVFIKCKGAALLHYYLKEVERVSAGILRQSGVAMIIDVDPYQML